MAGMIRKAILCFLFLELISAIGGTSVYSQDCFEDRFCFSLIFNQNSSGRSLTDAQNNCRNIQSKLAEISNRQVQDYVNEFLKNASSLIASKSLTERNVLVNAQRQDNGSWFWVNGKQLAGNININGNYNVARIWRNNVSYTIESVNVSQVGLNGYICECQNTTSRPTKQNSTFYIGDRFFVVNNSNETWFSARKRCIESNGDLASLDTLTVVSELQHSLDEEKKYWIGLRKSWWIWEGSYSEVKYTNWESNVQPFRPESNCISLNCSSTSLGQWSTTDCNFTSQLHYLCLYENSNETPESTTVSMENTTHVNKGTPTNILALGLGVGFGLCVALLTIVVVLLVVFIIKRRLLVRHETSPETSPSSAKKADARPSNGIPYYTEVKKHKRIDKETSGDSSQAIEAEEKESTTASESRATDAHRKPVYINVDLTQTDAV